MGASRVTRPRSDDAGRAVGDQGTAGPGERRYDSFHVRLWSQPGSERLLRAEVRHIQTDLAETATAVPAVWLLDALLALLAGEPLPAGGSPQK
jgi:hypothetical protein